MIKNESKKKNKNNIKLDKGFKITVTIIYIFVLTIGTAVNVSAASDPLTVINNLRDFIFLLFRTVGTILVGYGIFQIGMSLKTHDPSQKSDGLFFFAGGLIIMFIKEILDLILME